MNSPVKIQSTLDQLKSKLDDPNDLLSLLFGTRIFDKITEIENNPEISENIWIWELFENAKEAPNNSKNLSIKIEYDENSYIKFSHNANPFTIQQFLSLIIQISTKEKSIKDENFVLNLGNGFIHSNILNTQIKIKGIIEKNGKFKKFHFIMDREARNAEEMKNKMIIMIENIYNIFENNKKYPFLNNYKHTENDFDTTFLFEAKNERQKSIIKKTISNLTEILPLYLSMQNGLINKVELIDTKNRTDYIYNCEKKSTEKNICKITSIIRNKQYNSITQKNFFLVYLKENKFQLITEIVKSPKKGGNSVIKPKNEKIPNLFKNIPLIGSNNFYFPFIINGINFDLKNENFIENNIETISEIYDSSIEFINYILGNGIIDNRKYFAFFKTPKGSFAIDNDCYLENLQKNYFEKIQNLDLFKGIDDNFYSLKMLLLPKIKNKYNKEFYDLIQFGNLTEYILPKRDEYKEWCQFTSNEYFAKYKNYFYSINKFLDDISNTGSIKNLSLKINKDINQIFIWFNKIYEFIINNGIEINNIRYKIFPNKLGQLTDLFNLYIETTSKPIPNDIKNVYDDIFRNYKNSNYKGINSELIDDRINMENIILPVKNLDIILEELDDFSKNGDINLIFTLLSIQPENIIYQDKEAHFMFNLFQSCKNLNKIKINFNTKKYLWVQCKKQWFEQTPYLLTEKCKSIRDLKDFLKMEEEKYVLSWLNSYFNFYSSHNRFSILLKFYIFPNQNGTLCKYDKLKFEYKIHEHFKIITNKYMGYDLKANLFHEKLSFNYNQSDNKKKILDLTDVHKIIESYFTFNPNPLNKTYLTKKLFISKELVKIIAADNDQKAKHNKKLYDLLISIGEICGLRYNLVYIKTEGFDFDFSNKFLISEIIKKYASYGSFRGFSESQKYHRINENEFIYYIKNIIDYVINECDENIINMISDKNSSLLLNENLEFINPNIIEPKINNLSHENEKDILDLCSNRYINYNYKEKLLNKQIIESPKTKEYFLQKLKSLTDSDILKDIDDILSENFGGNIQNCEYNSEFSKLIVGILKIINNNKNLNQFMPFFSKNRNILTKNTLFSPIKSVPKISYGSPIKYIPRTLETGLIGEQKVYEYLKKRFKDQVNTLDDIKWLNKITESNEHYDIVLKLKSGAIYYFEVKSSEHEYLQKDERYFFKPSVPQLKQAEIVCNGEKYDRYYFVKVFNVRSDNPKFFFMDTTTGL